MVMWMKCSVDLILKEKFHSTDVVSKLKNHDQTNHQKPV